MLRVKIETDNTTYIVEDVTCYLNAIDILYSEVTDRPKIKRICNLDENDEEMEVVTFDE